MALTGFLLARAEILGGLYPFGPAFLGAIAVTYRRQIMVFILPLLLGVYTVMPVEQLYQYTAIFILLGVIFSLYNVDSKKQWIVVPSMVFAAVLVSKGLVLALGNYNNYLLLVSVFESIFAAGLSLVFMVVLTAVRRFDISRRFSSDETICLFVVLLSVTSGLAGWQIAGLSVQDMFSRFVIMVVAYMGGGGRRCCLRRHGRYHTQYFRDHSSDGDRRLFFFRFASRYFRYFWQARHSAGIPFG